MSIEDNATGKIRLPQETEPSLKRRALALYAIIVFKLIKGLLFVGLAAYLYVEATHNIPDDYQSFVNSPSFKFVLYHLKIHPEASFFTHLAERIAQLTEAKVHRAALGALLLSLFPLTEGVGLLFRVPWAGWMAIGESAFFVPIEFFKLAESFTWSIFIVTVINILIVWYLYKYRAVLFHHHHA